MEPTGEQDGQLVVQARGGFWSRWTTGGVAGYSRLARDAVVDGQWVSLNDWHPVDAEPCSECGHYQALCGLCHLSARHFLDAEWLLPKLYLCDWCMEPYFQYLEEEPTGRWEGVELGAYACCDGCGCDTWR